MINELYKAFDNEDVKNKMQKRLPHMFHLAELESSRAGKVGMQVGSIRESVISAFLIYKFGEKNVETELPITEAEVDVKLFGKPISIKTITGKEPSGVKLIWTVDAIKAKEFSETYNPSCDMIFVHVNWEGKGGIYYIPLEVQKKIFEKLGREKYIKLPKPGTNPRGVEITKEALKAIITDSKTKEIIIKWTKAIIQYNPYKRWVDLWGEE